MQEFYISENVTTDVTGYEHLIALYNNALLSDKSSVMFNFNRCETFDANLASVLGSLFGLLNGCGKKVYITKPKAKDVRRTLARNKFLSAFSVTTDIIDKENFIHYKRFSTSESKRFKEYIETGLIQKQKFPVHTDKAGKYIVENIFEIYVNAITHGNCEYVYSCGEYNDKDKTVPPVLDMTIVDCGNTIFRNVNNHLSTQKTPCEAIKWALVEGHTTKTTTGGLGLAQIEEFIKLNKGGLQIVSDSGMLELKQGEWNEFTLRAPFPGTIVNMKFNFNDNQIYYMETEEIDYNNLL